MSNCQECKFRKKYDRNPRSFLGRLWKWHTRWCPGWKGYLESLPEEERNAVQEKYKQPIR